MHVSHMRPLGGLALLAVFSLLGVGDTGRAADGRRVLRQYEYGNIRSGEPSLPSLPSSLGAVLSGGAPDVKPPTLGGAEPPSAATQAEAAAALTTGQEAWLGGLTDFLFFQRAFSPDEQRLAWASWTVQDKELYNQYNEYWITQTEAQKAALIKLIPFIGLTQSEFLKGLEVYIKSIPTKELLLSSLDSVTRYAYFKYDVYWGVLSDSERAELTVLVSSGADLGVAVGTGGNNSSGGSAPDGSLPRDAESFKEGLAKYLGFLLLPQAQQLAKWEGYTAAERELFFNYQGYWTSLSDDEQQQAIEVVAGNEPGTELPALSAQEEFLLGLNQYLVFISKSADEQALMVQGFSPDIVNIFASYQSYWEGLTASERQEHLTLIASTVGATAAAQGSGGIIDPALSEDFLLQLNWYLQFQLLTPEQQAQAWSEMGEAFRALYGRLEDYWLALSAEKQNAVMQRITQLLKSVPFATLEGLSYEQIVFLTGLSNYITVVMLPADQRAAVTVEWTLDDWDQFNKYDDYYKGLTAEQQTNIAENINLRLAEAAALPEPVAPLVAKLGNYFGALALEARQFLLGLVGYLEFIARPQVEQQQIVASLNTIQNSVLTNYQSYWNDLSQDARDSVLDQLQAPGVLNVPDTTTSGGGFGSVVPGNFQLPFAALPNSMQVDFETPIPGSVVSDWKDATTLTLGQVNFLEGLRIYYLIENGSAVNLVDNDPMEIVYSSTLNELTQADKQHLATLLAALFLDSGPPVASGGAFPVAPGVASPAAATPGLPAVVFPDTENDFEAPIPGSVVSDWKDAGTLTPGQVNFLEGLRIYYLIENGSAVNMVDNDPVEVFYSSTLDDLTQDDKDHLATLLAALFPDSSPSGALGVASPAAATPGLPAVIFPDTEKDFEAPIPGSVVSGWKDAGTLTPGQVNFLEGLRVYYLIENGSAVNMVDNDPVEVFYSSTLNDLTQDDKDHLATLLAALFPDSSPPSAPGVASPAAAATPGLPAVIFPDTEKDFETPIPGSVVSGWKDAGTLTPGQVNFLVGLRIYYLIENGSAVNMVDNDPMEVFYSSTLNDLTQDDKDRLAMLLAALFPDSSPPVAPGGDSGQAIGSSTVLFLEDVDVPLPGNVIAQFNPNALSQQQTNFLVGLRSWFLILQDTSSSTSDTLPFEEFYSTKYLSYSSEEQMHLFQLIQTAVLPEVQPEGQPSAPSGLAVLAGVLDFPEDVQPLPEPGQVIGLLSFNTLTPQQINFLVGLRSWLIVDAGVASADSIVDSDKWTLVYSTYWTEYSESERAHLIDLIDQLTTSITTDVNQAPAPASPSAAQLPPQPGPLFPEPQPQVETLFPEPTEEPAAAFLGLFPEPAYRPAAGQLLELFEEGSTDPEQVNFLLGLISFIQITTDTSTTPDVLLAAAPPQVVETFNYYSQLWQQLSTAEEDFLFDLIVDLQTMGLIPQSGPPASPPLSEEQVEFPSPLDPVPVGSVISELDPDGLTDNQVSFLVGLRSYLLLLTNVLSDEGLNPFEEASKSFYEEFWAQVSPEEKDHLLALITPLPAGVDPLGIAGDAPQLAAISLEDLVFPQPIEAPEVGKVIQTLGGGSLTELQESFLKGVQIFLLIDKAVPKEALETAPAQTQAMYSFYNEYWAKLGDDEKEILTALSG